MEIAEPTSWHEEKRVCAGRLSRRSHISGAGGANSVGQGSPAGSGSTTYHPHPAYRFMIWTARSLASSPSRHPGGRHRPDRRGRHRPGPAGRRGQPVSAGRHRQPEPLPPPARETCSVVCSIVMFGFLPDARLRSVARRRWDLYACRVASGPPRGWLRSRTPRPPACRGVSRVRCGAPPAAAGRGRGP